ncbi:alkane 1-monooxygenase [Leptospira sp. 2 VSF19]|uniref:Alkane 1-monooxygenase n=1 Tax=Leptospira soteropolitanensis TaxID=2950025 RepID=A0AAW5V9G6_9LEPT|nr:alkane 1-monooxygenase [Leptospira soteropolitanensis]MCW7492977.1 alkane 1-monooxygenase [Leptospira soteropolitanensis]MCW7500212.1 alkane 1-monooxygenase [Leptospira soteropolitanensis]MCW7522463.1 alkane 1-monooxygenase [Leptospira soteropolitanensis]MCW7526319.1 alkane 1-monooxygenase [Leptospira soteropolitanensis]MCW7529569.1 alkane 1-monooxygenase [Leptospira soteropolitanensis]
MTLTKRLSFLLCYILPVLTVWAETVGGISYLVVPITVFIVLPVLDFLIGKDESNPSKKYFLELQNDSYFRYLTEIWAYVQLIFVIWSVYRISFFPHTTTEFFLFALAVGIVTGGVGITVGHELGHKNTRYEQFLSKLIYMTVCYMHFYIEHNRGHHTNVSTPGDPATSRKNQSFYQFYPQTVFGAFQSAWELEKKRLSKLGLGVIHFRNEMIWYMVITLLFLTTMVVWGSIGSGEGFRIEILGFLLLQSFVAFSLLELTNYIEHYGLKRNQNTEGKFEKVLPIHSWNQNYFVSNALLFQLQRHSDHHANAGRRYQTLRHFDNAPQLPYGYEVMILIALVPPLWFSMMNPILESWEKKNSI